MHTSGCQKEMVEGLHIEYYVELGSPLQGERVDLQTFVWHSFLLLFEFLGWETSGINGLHDHPVYGVKLP